MPKKHMCVHCQLVPSQLSVMIRIYRKFTFTDPALSRRLSNCNLSNIPQCRDLVVEYFKPLEDDSLKAESSFVPSHALLHPQICGRELNSPSNLCITMPKIRTRLRTESVWKQECDGSYMSNLSIHWLRHGSNRTSARLLSGWIEYEADAEGLSKPPTTSDIETVF